VPAVVAGLDAGQRVIVSACTGSGKSHVIGRLCALYASDMPVVVSTPTQALVRQLAGSIEAFCPGRVGQFYADAKDADARIVVSCNASLGTLAEHRRGGLLIVDEAHRSESAEFRAAVDALRPEKMAGFSATPFRSAAHESLSLWDELAYRYTIQNAQREGVLVPYRPRPWMGDDSDLDVACLSLIREWGEGPGVVSALSIRDAQETAERYTGAGVECRAIHSRQSAAEQDRLRDALLAGDLRCLVHVALLTEGVDWPGLKWICLRRPVSSRVRVVQEVGRGLRTAPGKAVCQVLDPHNLLATLGLSHPEALGPALEAELERRESRNGEAGPVVLPPAVIVDQATAWTQLLLLMLREQGVVPLGPVAGQWWRERAPRAGQLRRLAGLSKYYRRFLPETARAGLDAVSKPPVSEHLQAGAVEDLIQLLLWVKAQDPRRAYNHRWNGPDWRGAAVPALPVGMMEGAADWQRCERNRARRESSK